jgi:flagellar basal-body rod protein FlgB
MLKLDNALGIHAKSLVLRSYRSEVLANNIANSDTPNFKARDFDFQKALQQAQTGSSAQINKTHQQHLGLNTKHNIDLAYRTSMQKTLDGNTVDAHQEINAFSQNAFQYEASLNFLNGRVKGIITALRGE